MTTFSPMSVQCVLFIYMFPSLGNVSFTASVLFFLSLQELIEVDSDIVFELASYILQVR